MARDNVPHSNGYLPPPYPGGFDASPAGGHSNGVNDGDKANVLDRPFFIFKRKRLLTAGVGNYAYTSLALAKNSLLGRGSSTHQQYRSIQSHPQVYVYGQALPTTGLGGLVAGQIAFQPLVNPYNNTVGKT